MKIGWIYWRDVDDHLAGEDPQFSTEEPHSWYYNITQIVYTEVITK